ncbi:MAG: class I SAM-dependent methyltransferase [Ferruginibacter sp.]
MTWEDTIKQIRRDPEFSQLVIDAFFDEDIVSNVERFRMSSEFIETLRLIEAYSPDATSILDIGSGNGISAISLALNHYNVLVIEPNKSDTVGAGAIKILKQHYSLSNIEIHECFAEEAKGIEDQFNVVYVRQALHHAFDLNRFVLSAATALKKNGVFIAAREHVIYNDIDKKWFLDTHPLQKLYGGENAFTLSEYIAAFEVNGLEILKILNHYETVINYYPLNSNDIKKIGGAELDIYRQYLIKKLPLIGSSTLVWYLYKHFKGLGKIKFPQDKNIPGRLSTFICKKK